jgi:N-acetylmuramoyl-L-alanine amidase
MLEPGKVFARAFGAAARAGALFNFPTRPSRPWVGNVLPALAARTAPNRGGSICLLILLLAGCATGPHENGSGTPDWEGANKPIAPAMPVAPVVPVSPAVAPASTPVLAPPAMSVATNQFTGPWVPLGRWCRANGLSAPCPLTIGQGPGYALSTTSGVFVLRAGSQVAHWDGLQVRLAFAPQIMGGQPCIHTLDLKKNIQPLVLGAPMSFLRTNLNIVIDPGHGGEDSGATSVLGHGYEKEFTLDWARRLGFLLATNGWRVFFTRTSDTDLSVSNRIAFAEAHQADLFLSLHFNSSAPNDQQSGLETYCLTPTGMPSTLTRGFGDDLGLAFPNNAFDAQNLQFALRVHRALLQVNGRRDRGVRRARFLGVLRGQHCPAILVEGGYLSNPQEARRIADPAYRQKLAEALAQALE